MAADRDLVFGDFVVTAALAVLLVAVCAVRAWMVRRD